jgi:tRNA-splicing ligase RtcB
MSRQYITYAAEGQTPIKAWVQGVPMEAEALKQLENVASLPFIFKHVAVMPDVHYGRGATIGSVIATDGAIIPAAVGVDIGCGMMAVQTGLHANDLPDNLKPLRNAIENAVPTGFGKSASHSRGGWSGDTLPKATSQAWDANLVDSYLEIMERHPGIRSNPSDVNQLGSLGSGNHFIEVCLDEDDIVWIMLHSGSRGIGNRIGRYFTEIAKQDMKRFFVNLPDVDLAYLPEGTDHFDDYLQAVGWAQDFARINRTLMMSQILDALKRLPGIPQGKLMTEQMAVNCHHNYVQKEHHFGRNVMLTRKGAVSAREGQLGIIPGSMGARSFIVQGKGNAESFTSCSHGAGRAMSRRKAKETFSLDDHIAATQGVECRKDEAVLDETPGAYKDIQAVMDAQSDLVDIVTTLQQIVCVKG